MTATAQDEAVLLGRKHAERHAELPDDERELADLREAGRHGERRAEPRGKHNAEHHVDEPFAHHDEGDDGKELGQVRGERL